MRQRTKQRRGGRASDRAFPYAWLVAWPALLLAARSASADEGARLYAKDCAGCHQASGAGLAPMFPPLNNLGIWLARPDGRQWIADAVVNGPYGEIAVGGKIYNSGMPGYGRQLSNAQITAVMRYVAETLNAPPAGYTPFVEEMVAAARLVPDDGVSMKAIRGQLPMR